MLFNIQLMLANPTGKLERLVTNLLTENNYLLAIEKALRNYKIKSYNIACIKPYQILQSYYEIERRFYTQKNFRNTQTWCQNELKIYLWLLVGYSFLQKRCISEMNITDWTYFSQIFKDRDPNLLQYHALLILKTKEKHLKWSTEEIELLNKILNNNKSQPIKNTWNQTARDLYLLSSRKYFRTAKQCRQYWINHLDPTPVKSSWSSKQDAQLIQWAYGYNKKWARISKLFGGKRTEHMVKNRFNSLYHSEIKKYLSNGNSIESLNENTLMENLKVRLQSNIDCQDVPFFSTFQEIEREKQLTFITEKKQHMQSELLQLDSDISKNKTTYSRVVDDDVNQYFQHYEVQCSQISNCHKYNEDSIFISNKRYPMGSHFGDQSFFEQVSKI